jgi:hypothetical protein
LRKEVCKETDQLTLGPEFNYEQVVYTCNACGEQGDFQGVNDTRFLEAQKEAQIASMKSLIETLFEDKNFSMAYFERAFELPIRTVTRWKGGDFSAAAIALLRTVRTYPWIVEVAANRFEPRVAHQVLVKEGVALISNVIAVMEGSSVQMSVKEDSSAVSATAVWTLNKQPQPKLVAVGG